MICKYKMWMLGSDRNPDRNVMFKTAPDHSVHKCQRIVKSHYHGLYQHFFTCHLKSKMCRECRTIALSEWTWGMGPWVTFSFILILRLFTFSVPFRVYKHAPHTKCTITLGKWLWTVDHQIDIPLIMNLINRLLIVSVSLYFLFSGTVCGQQNYQFWFLYAITSWPGRWTLIINKDVLDQHDISEEPVRLSITTELTQMQYIVYDVSSHGQPEARQESKNPFSQRKFLKTNCWKFK